MGAPKKADWREERRKHAWELYQQEWKQKDIATVLGVSEGAVSQWLKRGREGGEEALKAHPSKGAMPRLRAGQKAQIPELLAKGAPAHGFRGDVWTARRVAEVIYRTSGVRYHRDHVGRLLSEAGKTSYDAEAVIGFLRVLLRKIKGKILIIWDGSPIHRSKEIKAFLKAGAAKRLHLEQFPGYAPDLNPDEGIWNYLKRVELCNVCCSDLDQLYIQVIRAKERLRHKRDILLSCSSQCGYLTEYSQKIGRRRTGSQS